MLYKTYQMNVATIVYDVMSDMFHDARNQAVNHQP